MTLSSDLSVSSPNPSSTSSESAPPYEILVGDLPDEFFRVHAFEGKELLSDTYHFDVIVTASPNGDVLQEELLRQPARFIWNVGKAPRAFYGVIASIEVEPQGDASGAVKYRLRFVPRLWLLTRITRSRVYQNQSVPAIVSSVLSEIGVSIRWQLLRAYPVREYVTQYEEDNYAFVQRLLAEAGIFFYFAQGGQLSPAALTAASAASAAGSLARPALGSVGDVASVAQPLVPGDTVIGADDAAFYPALGPDNAGVLAVEGAASLATGAALAAGNVSGRMGSGAGAVMGGASAAAGAAIGALSSSAPTLYFLRAGETSRSHQDRISRFALRNTVESNSAAYREYDPDRPMTRLTNASVSSAPFPPSPVEVAAQAAAIAGTVASAVAPTAVGELSAGVGGAGAVANTVSAAMGQPGAILETYHHDAPFLFPKWPFAVDDAPRILRQKRRAASMAEGESGCSDLAPGHRFALSDHPVPELDRTYAAVEVSHRGQTHPQPGTEWRVYWNRFGCVPTGVTYVPPRPQRRCVQTLLTATVVGPPGVEIHVDASGQIKVQFHWDREGGFSDGSSCWIRTMHPWGGAGWGVQFIPRVGMEVVVGFLDGDPDKPTVLGSLYNATHPSPFALPGDKTRSGWRTQSSPGGGGFNELSFEDAAAQEQIYLHAQRNLDEVVERNHTLRVMNDEFLRIVGNRMDRIEKNLEELVQGNQTSTVEKNLEERVRGDHTSHVEGNRVDVVTGNRDDRVSGALVTRLEQKEWRAVTGTADLEYADDLTTRVKGCMTTIVGKHDKKRSMVLHAEGTAKLSSLDATEVSSDGEIVLRVGKSSIRMKDDQIELSSPSILVKGAKGGLLASDDGLKLSSQADAQFIVKQKLVLKTDGASLAMEKEVKVDGQQILLNSPEQATDTPPKAPDPPTKIELKDQDGNPLPHQRFIVKLSDETELGGVTDKDGKAELDLASSGKISFPEVSADDKPGTLKPYVVRQGDYLQKLALMLGFDADAVWGHAKNVDLKKLRDPNQLHPGDILHVPAPALKWEALSKGTTNSYTVTVPKTPVTLALRDDKGPLANEPYEIDGLSTKSGTTDGNGTLKVDVPVLVREFRVRLTKKGLTFPVRVGDMDPIDEPSGPRKRLENLAYLSALAEPLSEEEEERTYRLAIMAFQEDSGLNQSGELDDATKKALAQAHGS